MFCPKCGSPLSGPSQPCLQCESSLAEGQELVKPSVDSKAVFSLVLGVLAIPLSIFAGIPAVVLGHISRSSVRRSAGRLRGSGLALWGLILGYLSVVILVCVIVSGVAIPRFFHGQIAVNEASALNTLRSINFAASTYQVEHSTYPPTLQELGAASLFPLDNAVTSLGTQSGYRFTYKRTASGTGYALYADPISIATGKRHFYSDATGVIRFEDNRRADSASATLSLLP